MPTLQSLIDDVYIITNRPDLVSETRLAVRKAIFKCHISETFARDILKTRLQMSLYTPISPNSFRYQFDLTDSDLFPRFRRLQALQYPMELIPPFPPTPAPLIDGILVNGAGRVIPIVANDNLFDQSYRIERAQYAYTAGSSLNMKLGWGMDYLDISYWAFPSIPSNPSDPVISWIADQYPDCIVEEACSAIFKMIGKDDEAGRYLQLFAENYAMLKGISVGEDAQ